MDNLFSVIVLVAAGVLLFIFYYAGRNKYRSVQETRLRFSVMRKIYEDERTYCRHYLRFLLGKLKKGELSWVQVASRLHPHDKIEIVFNHLTGQIQLYSRHIRLSTVMIADLKNIGMTEYSYKDEINLLSMPVNAKIVTDAVYYYLEKIYGHKKAKNIKINISGGSE
jgi:hypothetical protein